MLNHSDNRANFMDRNNNRFMQSGINKHFPTQKVIADMQLKETLRSISSYSGYDDEALPAYLDSDKPVIHIMKSVLKAADIPKNLFDKSVLENRYKDYCARITITVVSIEDGAETAEVDSAYDIESMGQGVLFSINDLFEEGWLVDCGNEWMHNCNPKRYKGLTFDDCDREKQIIDFLTRLSDIDAYDIGLTFDPKNNEDLLKSLNTSIEELVKAGILYVDENPDSDSDIDNCRDSYDERKTFYISSYIDIWRSLGALVLSSLLNESIEEDDNYYDTWLNYCRYLRGVWNPERYVADKEALYNYCLKITRTLHIDEDMESQKFNKALWLSSNCKRTANIPSNPRLREEYFGQRVDYFHELKFISYFSYTIAGTALDICCRLYSHVQMDIRKGLIDVLSDPFFSILNNYHGNLMNPDLSVDAMKQERLCYLSLVTIYGQFQSRATDRTNEIYAVEKFADELWDVVYNHISAVRIDGSQDGVIEAFVEFLIYLGQSCGFGEERLQNGRGRHSAFGHNKTALTFFSIMIEKHTEELGEYEPVDRKVRRYIIDCLDSENKDEVTTGDVEITRYLRLLFAFTSSRGRSSFYYNEWMDCSLEQLVKRYKRCAGERFSISTIPYRSIVAIVDECSDESNADKLSQFAKDILGYTKKIQGDGYKDKANRRWGGYVGLSLLTAAIKRKSRSEVQRHKPGRKAPLSSIKEEIDLLIDIMASLQKSDRFLSRESIYQYEAEELFKECTSMFPLFNRAQRNRFIANVCDDLGKAIQKIDLLTWSAFISDNDIRIGLVESATDGVSQVEAIEIVGVVADSVIMPIDFTDIVNLAIWYKEEYLGEWNDSGKDDSQVVEDTVLTGLIYIAEAMLERYKKWEKQAGSYLQDRRISVASWIENAERQLEYIRGEKDALRQSEDDFYKGIGYLESRDEDNLVEAARYFDKVYKNKESISAGINLMSALAQLINVRREKEEPDNEETVEIETKENTEKNRKGYDRFDISTANVSELLQQIEELYKDISIKIHTGKFTTLDYGFYYNILMAYALCNKADEFWDVYRVIPDDLVLEPNITEFAVRVYLSEGKKDKAKRLYEKCRTKYATGKKLDDIKMIIDSDGQEVPVNPMAHKDFDGADDPTQIEIERVLNYLKRAPGIEVLKAFGIYAEANEVLLCRLGLSRLNESYDKLLVLEMLLSAASELERHSRSMLWKWKDNVKVPDENTFNRTLMTFVNKRETRVLGYRASDQTQAGKSGRDSDRRNDGNVKLLEDDAFKELEHLGVIDPKDVSQFSMGELDILIGRGESSVCIVEGIKVFKRFENNQGLTDYIIDHISKVHTYDTKRIHLYAIMIYSGSYEGNYSEMYDQYKKLLMKLKDGYSGEGKDKSGCYIVDVMTDVSPKDLGILGESSNYQNLCITVHRDPRKHLKAEKIIMFHLFMDVWQ